MAEPRIEYVPADPRLRLLAGAFFVAALLTGAAAVLWFLPWLTTALQGAVAGETQVPLACYLFLAAVAGVSLGAMAFGIYGARFGRRVLATGQYPPPNTRVIRDTRILRGPVATFTGRGQFMLGLTIVACGIALFAFAIWGFVLLA